MVETASIAVSTAVIVFGRRPHGFAEQENAWDATFTQIAFILSENFIKPSYDSGTERFKPENKRGDP